MNRRSFVASLAALFAWMLPKRRISWKKVLDPNSKWGQEAGKMLSDAVAKRYRAESWHGKEVGILWYREMDEGLRNHGVGWRDA